MTDFAFPSHIAAALDRLVVPQLPSGFSDRLVARIAAGDLPADTASEIPPLPMARRATAGRRWLRPGRVFVGVALLGVTTATAAASGMFGEPVYVPVVSEALAGADIVALPRPVSKLAKSGHRPPVQLNATGPAAVQQLYDRLRADKDFRALPPRERTAVARKELQAMLRAGTIKPEDIRTVVAELRDQRLQKELDRRQAVAERKERYRNADPQEKAAMREEQRERAAKQLTQIRASVETLPSADKRRLQQLRRELRDAPLAERPAIRREIRAILRMAQDNFAASEGNKEPVR